MLATAGDKPPKVHWCACNCFVQLPDTDSSSFISPHSHTRCGLPDLREFSFSDADTHARLKVRSCTPTITHANTGQGLRYQTLSSSLLQTQIH